MDISCRQSVTYSNTEISYRQYAINKHKYTIRSREKKRQPVILPFSPFFFSSSSCEIRAIDDDAVEADRAIPFASPSRHDEAAEKLQKPSDEASLR